MCYLRITPHSEWSHSEPVIVFSSSLKAEAEAAALKRKLKDLEKGKNQVSICIDIFWRKDTKDGIDGSAKMDTRVSDECQSGICPCWGTMPGSYQALMV